MTKQEYERAFLKWQLIGGDRSWKDPNRLHFHLHPRNGWMNDPNGLCQHKGVHHLYFQYTPFQTTWGTKLWGQFTTEDFIHFKEHHPFLYTDASFDRNGVYSGSALVVDDTIHYFYTGNVKHTDKAYDYILDGREHNTIHLSSKDGLIPGEKEIQMTNKEYPSDMTRHVRDPKVFSENGTYYMILGARDINDVGCALLYRSSDLSHWEFHQRIGTTEPFGYQWECPDLFKIDGQWILSISPQGLPHESHKNQNVYQCGYIPVTFDEEGYVTLQGEFQEYDMGFDFYAAQSYEDQQGRRILIAWMGMPDSDYNNDPTTEYGWIHAMTMPRRLTFRNGKVCQEPIEEMKALRRSTYTCTMEKLKDLMDEECCSEELKDFKVDGCYELKLSFEEPTKPWKLSLRKEAELTFDGKELCLSLGTCGYGRTVRRMYIQEIQEMTIFSDTSSLEIFINHGEKTMTTRVFSSGYWEAVSFVDSAPAGTATIYQLGEFKITPCK